MPCFGCGFFEVHDDPGSVRKAQQGHGELKSLGRLLLLTGTLSLGACGGVETCDEPEFYEFASGGRRIEAPDDLDNLAPSKEMVIPDASPRPPRDRSAGCLDRPPTLRVGDPDEDETDQG